MNIDIVLSSALSSRTWIMLILSATKDGSNTKPTTLEFWGIFLNVDGYIRCFLSFYLSWDTFAIKYVCTECFLKLAYIHKGKLICIQVLLDAYYGNLKGWTEIIVNILFLGSEKNGTKAKSVFVHLYTSGTQQHTINGSLNPIVDWYCTPVEADVENENRPVKVEARVEKVMVNKNKAVDLHTSTVCLSHQWI